VGNPTRIQYPSGFALNQTFDPLNRPSAIDWAANTSSSYSHPVSQCSPRNGSDHLEDLEQRLYRHPSVRRRPPAARDCVEPVGLPREPGLDPAQPQGSPDSPRSERRGNALRLRWCEPIDPGDQDRQSGPRQQLGARARDFTKLADAFAYAYDPAQNLLSTTKKENGIPDAVALPLDGSKRNRPGAVGSEALTWDANGNLLSKGDLRFQYDYRNRLTRVSHANGDEVATYEYEVGGRWMLVIVEMQRSWATTRRGSQSWSSKRLPAIT
jgi:hypothetical protein